ncbi:Zinc-iron permease [Globisporangium polare]
MRSHNGVLALLLHALASAVAAAASPTIATTPAASFDFFLSNAASASPWLASSVYALREGEHALQFCTQDPTVLAQGGMVFEILQVSSTQASDVAAATSKANAVLHTFSSQRVVRESVVNGSVVELRGNDSDSVEYLYRAEFEEAAPSATAECVNAMLPITTTGEYMLFTEFTSQLVQIAIRDAKTDALVPILQCVSGCGNAAALAPENAGWLGPVIASLLISLTSIVGVVILSFDKGHVEVIVEYMTSFGAGCLLGVVVFHLYPEGSAYLSDVGHWIMGACVLGGIVLSMSIEAGVHTMLSVFGVDHCDDGHSHGHHPHHDHSTMDHLPETQRVTLSPESQSPHGHSHASHHVAVAVKVDDDALSEHEPLVSKVQENGHGHSHGHSHNGHSHQRPRTSSSHHRLTFYAKHIRPLLFVDPVAWITAVGDFFHAFTDGVVLAVAFKSCSSALGWAVALGIVLHEVPHRVGDFFIFLKAGMTVPQALVVNFFASMASLLGVFILLASGAVGRHTLGVLLGVGTGALLFIGLAELLPPMLAVRERQALLLHFVWFALGCIVIGLSLLQDTHCHV